VAQSATICGVDDAAPGLPPLAAEDFVCAECDIAYPTVDVVAALETTAAMPGEVRRAVADVPVSRLRVRPEGARQWSALEYLCHLRDVYVTYTIRLYRGRTEQRPTCDPMLNDLRSRRFAYNGSYPGCVLDQLDATVVGYLDEAQRVAPDQWERTIFRPPDDERTLRWLVRQAMHEGVHHLGDVRRCLPGDAPA
jgi:hypothetical protein